MRTEAVYTPILEQLADHQPKSPGQLETALKSITFAQLLQAALVLTGNGAVAPAQDEATIAKAKKRTERLNHHLMTKSRGSNDIVFLASPVTGGGIPVPRFHQLFLLARQQGRKTLPEWAQFVWQLLAAQGQHLIKEGQTLQTPEENLAELTAQAKAFADRHLPVLKALQVV